MVDTLIFPAGPDAFGHFHMAQIGLVIAFGAMCLAFRNLIGGARTLIQSQKVAS